MREQDFCACLMSVSFYFPERQVECGALYVSIGEGVEGPSKEPVRVPGDDVDVVGDGSRFGTPDDFVDGKVDRGRARWKSAGV